MNDSDTECIAGKENRLANVTQDSLLTTQKEQVLVTNTNKESKIPNKIRKRKSVNGKKTEKSTNKNHAI